MKPGISVGLTYWSAALLTIQRGHLPGAYSKDLVFEKLDAKARELAKKYGCQFSGVKTVAYGTGFAEHGEWQLYKFTCYTVDGAACCAHELGLYIARFKGITPVSKEHLDYQGNPKIWSD